MPNGIRAYGNKITFELFKVWPALVTSFRPDSSTFSIETLVKSAVIAILFLIANLFGISQALGQTNTWDGTSGANWNTAANWSLNHVPLATEAVVIPNGITTTITVNTAAVCSSFTMNSGGTTNTVTISGTNSLTVTNGISIGGGTTGLTNKTLAVNAGSLSCASLTMSTTLNDNTVTSLTITTGSATVTGDLTMNDADVNRNIVRLTSTGTLYVGGALTGGDLTTVTGSTVNYNGAAQTVRAVNYNGNLTFSGSDAKTLQTATTAIGGNLTLSGTATTTGVVGLTIGGIVTLGNGTSFTAGSFTHNVAGNWVNNGATFTNTNSTINLNGAAQNIGGTSSTTFNNLTLAGTSTKTFSIATFTAGNFSISTGVVANLSTITTHTANTLTLGTNGQNTGTWGGTSSGATNINSTFFATATGILTVTNRIYYSRATGSWNSTGTWSTVTYGNATNTGTFPVAGDVVNIGGGNYTITVNVASACGSLSYREDAPDSPTVSIGTGITLNVSGAITIPRADNNAPDVNTLAVGGGTLNAGSIAFTNAGTEVRHRITISTGTVVVAGDVTGSGGNTSGSIIFTGAGLLQLGGSIFNSSDGTLTTATGSTVEYNGTDQTVGDFTYYNLTLSGSGVKDLTNVSDINGNFIMSGTASTTATENIDIEGSVTLGSGTSFTAGAYTHTVAGNWINNGGTFNNTSSTISLNGAAQSIGGSTSTTFNNLILAGSNTKTFGISTAIGATLSINTGIVANLSTITTHTARTLALNNVGQVPGTWGGTTSAATNINTTYFATATGILNVTNRIYYSRASNNWNTTTTWSTVSYTSGTNTGTFPVAGDIVNIGGGDRNIVVNVASACAFINYQDDANFSPTVSINAGISLNVSDAIIIPRADNNDVNTLAVGAGTLNAGSIAFTNGGGDQRHELTISTGTVTVSGDVTQSGSSGSATITFTGAGLLRLGGAFLNSTNGTLVPGTGTVLYNGTTPQTIGDFTYYNLSLNNTSSTQPQLTLIDNTTATNTLTMTSGVVNLNNATFTLGASGGASTLSRTASTTTNWMYGGTFSRFWRSATAVTSTSGNFYGLFPVGASAASSYRPVAINSTASPTATGSFSVTHTDASSVTDLSPVFNDAGTDIVRKHNSRFVTTSSATGGTYNIDVTMTGLSTGTLSDIRLAVNNGATTVTTVGTHVAATGSATNPTAGRTGVILANLIGDFRITTINSVVTPLPIELASFSVVLKNSVVELSWTTASERNNDFFTIERASNIEEFEVIGDPVDGKGTTSERSNYSASDENPIYGRSYYRLKQTDFDGAFTYSSVRTIDYDGPEFSVLKVYPNPSAGDQINIELIGLKNQATVPLRIYNFQGQIVFDRVFDVTTPGTLKQNLEFSSPLKQGLYIIKAGQSLRLTQKIIID